MTQLRRGVIRSYVAASGLASVQLVDSLPTQLLLLPLASNINLGHVRAGREVAVLFFTDDSPADAVIIASYPAPAVDERYGFGTDPTVTSSGPRLEVAKFPNLGGGSSLILRVDVSGVQTANASTRQGFAFAGTYDLAGFNLTNFFGLASVPTVQDAGGTGVLGTFDGMRAGYVAGAGGVPVAVTDAAALDAVTPTGDVSSVVTLGRGVRVRDQGAAFTTDAIGVDIEAQSDGPEIRLAQQAAIGTLDGGVHYDSTQHDLEARVAGLLQKDARTLFVKTQDSVVVNTASESSLCNGSGVGGRTLPANFFVVGKTVRVEAWGYFASDGTAAQTLTIRLRIGGVTGTVVLATGAISLTAVVANRVWHFKGDVTCRTTGASGTVMAQGAWWAPDQVLTYTTYGIAHMLNAGTVTLDTTVGKDVELTADWNSADAGDSITCTNFTVEVLA